MLNLTAARILSAFLAAIAIAACTSSSSEETGTSSQEQITDIASMVQRADGRFDVVCKNGSTEIVTAAQLQSNQVCSGGGGGGNRVIIYGTSDRCDNDSVVASVTPATDCNTLSDAQSAWSVKVNGQCNNINDTTVRKACFLHQPGRTLIYGTSDHCDNDSVVASVGENTDCTTLSDSQSAWSIKANGQCINISDTTVRKACLLNQPNRVLIYGTSDHCDSDSIVASVGPTTDCTALSDAQSAWSVKVNGQCLNISDTTVRKACILHQP
jgi:hypothetical protein